MPPVGNRGADDGMLQANGVDLVRMFDAEPWTAGALVDTRIQIVIAVPEDQIAYVSSDPRSGRLWVRAERLLLPQDQHRRQVRPHCFSREMGNRALSSRYGLWIGERDVARACCLRMHAKC
ncbi:Os05g0531700 [Oryza sativa Japonica Group]|uniref:Os05g0531700 protein n=1 Tax=Oryza sativa subsp. japonica TaxID=39947 RepID=A0A0N7KL51_ORYSJ|nr:hypothetical protein EE612_030805 [Oryza sativa]KAF2931787.1 hypothetical protein DAI22_05g237500 [Oryza sativa Japonica Group]BAS95041.1 Os05g0531700 [Oryza sativa Japonica Group]